MQWECKAPGAWAGYPTQQQLWVLFAVTALGHLGSFLLSCAIHPDGFFAWYFTQHVSMLTLLWSAIVAGNASFPAAWLRRGVAAWSLAIFCVFVLTGNAAVTTGYWLLDRGTLRSSDRRRIAEVCTAHTLPIISFVVSLCLEATQAALRQPLARYSRRGFGAIYLLTAAAHVGGQLLIGYFFLYYQSSNRYDIESESDWGWNVLLSIIVIALATPIVAIVERYIVAPAAERAAAVAEVS